MSALARVIVVPAKGDYPAAAAREIAARMRAALARGDGRLRLALSGGTTPGPVHERLAAEDLPWGRVEIGFADERCVPADDPESNFALARATLLERLPVPPAAVLRMEAEAADPQAAARRYGALLERPFDLVLLGIGEDGHTASLFPGQASLLERERRVLHVLAPEPPAGRLTLAPRALREARALIVLARGSSKAPAVASALAGGNVRRVPARLARGGTWILDAAAAGLRPPAPGTARPSAAE